MYPGVEDVVETVDQPSHVRCRSCAEMVELVAADFHWYSGIKSCSRCGRGMWSRQQHKVFRMMFSDMDVDLPAVLDMIRGQVKG